MESVSVKKALNYLSQWQLVGISMAIILVGLFGFGKENLAVASQGQVLGGIATIEKAETNFIVTYQTGEKAQINILNDKLFRYHMDPNDEFLDYPIPNNPEHVAKITAKTLEEYGDTAFKQTTLEDLGDVFKLSTSEIQLLFQKETGLMSVINQASQAVILQESSPISYKDNKMTQSLSQSPDEYYFGGGTQNGRFTHKGNEIKIVNTNNWVDGGVASPNPFYWSTKGYGVVRNTWQPGSYDFGRENPQLTVTTHEGSDFDAFYFFDTTPGGILNSYYELTGPAVLMPEYGFYEAHLNAYNRDSWVEVTPEVAGAIQFEDGKWYKEFQPGNAAGQGGILESLNGEKDNYQFSARAVIDRYRDNDMPLGWFLPNDGYGAGYGQTNSLDGDIQNLKSFTEYANQNGVEVGLWTQSNLYPKNPDDPQKGERDIEKEVSEAGVKALKTDVAWVGNGYSFGLNGVEDAAKVFVEQTQGNVRPMIVTLDGWAGTQRYGGIWTGDQTGGQWEYIRFHIPTYIGTSLSGQPNVGSDMDGIFGGKNKDVNIRDFQWKTFTPIQLNMDGWGSNPKTPFAFDQETTDINRAYLKLKSMLMPYNYSLGYEAISGLPMVRGMALEFPQEASGYTTDSQYQFMWGENLLVAPVYNEKVNQQGDALRDGIYLPDENQIWIDFFTGEKFQGGRTLNGVVTPLWKLPVYVKDGGIIPMVNPNNNPNEIDRGNRRFLVYPNQQSDFEVYEDDGISTGYQEGAYATTRITSQGPQSNQKGTATISVAATEGTYAGFVSERSTQFDIMASEMPEAISVVAGGETLQLKEAKSKAEFEGGNNLYFLDREFQVNQYLTDLTGTATEQSFLSIKVEKQDVSTTDLQVTLTGFINEGRVAGGNTEEDSDLAVPANLRIVEEATTPTSLTVTWDAVDQANGYEVERDGSIFSNIQENTLTFTEFTFLSEHQFRVRSVGEKGVSPWSEVVVGQTSDDPFKDTIDNVKATSNIPDQNGEEIEKLTDKDLTSMWHTNWYTGIADPANGQYLLLNFDLGKEYQMEKFEYYPRENAGNGNIQKIQYRTSVDGINWSDYSEEISWNSDASVKTIVTPEASYRFVEIKVLQSVGNFGSGNEMLFYKKAGTDGILWGDITNDGVIDENDALSYRNYTGLETVDSDFNGYVESGDLNKNGVIDAYDIHYVLRQLDGGIPTPKTDPIAGGLSLVVTNNQGKNVFQPGDTLTFTLKGVELVDINALSLRLNFDSNRYELSKQPTLTAATQGMENYSKYRKHSNDVENLYLVLSNQGNQTLLNGNLDLLTFSLQTKVATTRAEIEDLVFKASQGLLVGQGLQQAEVTDFEVIVTPSMPVDKTILEALVNVNASRQPEEYTTETWQIFEDSLNYAQRVLDADGATQEEVTQAIDELNEAIKQLEQIEESVNKEALAAKIIKGLTLKPSEGTQFTFESQQALDKALSQAQEIFANPQATQAEVDEALANLDVAILGIVEENVAVDKEALIALIEKASNLVPQLNHEFTENSLKQLAEALETAQEIVEATNTTQAEVDSVITMVENALNSMEEVPLPTDTTALLAALKKAEEVEPDDGYIFTLASVTGLQKAIEKANQILLNPLATQSEIDEVTKEVEVAIANLQQEKQVINKESLRALLTKAKALKPKPGFEFTIESKKVLEEAIKNAEALLTDNQASQAAVDLAEEALQKAIDGLEEKKVPVSKTKLEGLIEEAETIKSAAGKAFTNESLKGLREALSKGKIVLANQNATQKEVDSAIENLEKALADLEEIALGATGSTPTFGTEAVASNSGKGTSQTSYPKTGEKVNQALVIIGASVILIGVGLKVYLKRKRG